MENFYQNYRQYVKSRSKTQLTGKDPSSSDLENCEPIVKMKDLGRNTSVNGTFIPETAVASPCGLIAKSFFNDTYELFTSNGSKLNISETNIAWGSDKVRFKRHPNWETTQWLDVENEHFMIWMRVAAFPNFRKLWGRIQGKMTKGNYVLKVNNNYNVTDFNGKKKVVISNANEFGGNNDFLAICYLTFGFFSILCCLVLSIKKIFKIGKFSSKTL